MKEGKKRAELLAPAGNMECLRTALYFGADAVYCAGKQFGLRAFAANFSLQELSEAAEVAHAQGKKLYVTVNALLREGELTEAEEYMRALRETGIDAVIVSDPAAAIMAREAGIELHISTQMSICNSSSAGFWHAFGAKRIVLGRETTLEEIAQIRKNCPETMEIEAFVHGAMCVAHSGRCLLSSVFTGRSGNRGECAQPCRWEYTISEAGYPGEYFPILEDGRGTYVLNSKDLNMIGHIPALIEAGISSLKIEGRMKSAYYVACVTNAYRRALDAFYANPGAYAPDPALTEELEMSATRRFTTGFYFGNPRAEGQDTEKALSPRGYTFCAKVLAPADGRGLTLVEQRNKFSVGDTLKVLSPHMAFCEFMLETLENEDGDAVQAAPHAQQRLYLRCPFALRPGDMLRRR